MSTAKSIGNKLILEESRRRNDQINQSFNEARNRMLIFLSVEIAIMAYFFSDLRNIFPKELYGQAFFAIGALCILISIGLLSNRYRMISDWPSPIGPVEEEKIKHSATEDEIYDVMLSDYEAANNKANQIMGRHAKTIDLSLLLFIIGAIILLVIKFFQ